MQKVDSQETKEREIPQELELAEEVQSDLYAYLTKFDDKVVQTLRRQKALLRAKYQAMMNHLEKLRKQLEVYESKVNKLEKEIDENDHIKKILVHMGIYKSYAKMLLEKFIILDQRIKEEQIKIVKNLELVHKKRKVIFQVNHENITFSNNISKCQKILDKNKSLILPSIETTRNSNKTENNNNVTVNTSILSLPTQGNTAEKGEIIMKKLKLYEKKNICLRKDILNKAINFTEMKRFFEDSLDVYTKNVIKSQEVIKSDGLKGSLLFEIKKNRKSDILNSFIIENNPSKIQEREAKNLVNRILNTLVEKKESKKATEEDPFVGLNLDWETFNKLDGRQIMGLLSVKPDVLEDMRKKMDSKQRAINEMLSELKTR